MQVLDDFLNTRSKWQLIFITGVMIVVFASLDLLTGFEISLSVFYLIPIAFSAWYLSRQLTLVACFVAAVAWLVVDYSSGHLYSLAWILYWNGSIRLAFFIIVAHLIASLKTSLNDQQSLLRSDALTGVRSLRAFEEEANIALRLAARHHQPICLGYIDLDEFKQLNDAMGHAMGDKVLQMTGAQLNAMSRVSDIAARIGGDEFVVLLHHTNQVGAEEFFSRLHKKLIKTMQNNGWPIGFSIGVAIFPDGNIELDRAREFADSLMYKAKKSGKNSVVYAVYPDSELRP